jgi:hypothetical protein
MVFAQQDSTTLPLQASLGMPAVWECDELSNWHATPDLIEKGADFYSRVLDGCIDTHRRHIAMNGYQVDVEMTSMNSPWFWPDLFYLQAAINSGANPHGWSHTSFEIVVPENCKVRLGIATSLPELVQIESVPFPVRDEFQRMLLPLTEYEALNLKLLKLWAEDVVIMGCPSNWMELTQGWPIQIKWLMDSTEDGSIWGGQFAQ